MNRKLATILSYILHPAVYPLLGVLAVIRFTPFFVPSNILFMSMGLVFVGTYVLPVCISYLLYRLTIIRSLEMKTAKDRRIPYMLGALCYYLVAMLIEKIQLPREAYLYLLACTMVIVVHLVSLLYFKPSAHLAGIGGFTGLLLALSLKYAVNLLPFLAVCFLLAGFLASARLFLKAHDGRELISGYFSGLLLVGVMVYFS